MVMERAIGTLGTALCCRVMTAEEKRDRRKARHELEKVFRRIVTRRIGLFATNRQIRDGVKVMTDRYYAEQIRPAAERIEQKLLAEEQAKAS
jgi:hypothetical protein